MGCRTSVGQGLGRVLASAPLMYSPKRNYLFGAIGNRTMPYLLYPFELLFFPRVALPRMKKKRGKNAKTWSTVHLSPWSTTSFFS